MKKQWVCSVCGYVYDGEVPFEKLPDDWTCPLCGVGKDLFVEKEVQKKFYKNLDKNQKRRYTDAFFHQKKRWYKCLGVFGLTVI